MTRWLDYMFLGLALACIALLLPLAGPGRSAGDANQPAAGFSLHAAAFGDGGAIPARYTCSGVDISPQLGWSRVPGGTQALMLIVDDPDAPSGTFTHWMLYNLGSRYRELPEGLAKTEQVLTGAAQGRNDFGKIGYSGPCPPPGKPHRYFFRLYALDTKLSMQAGASRQELDSAKQGHVLGQAELVGTFQR